MKTIDLNGRRISPGKIVCVGKNYADHIKEMGGGGDRLEEPTIFIKPSTAVMSGTETVFIPNELGLLHHEVELCFVVGKDGCDIAEREASRYIIGWGVGIDFTLRDRQSAAKKLGGPWALSKGFDGSAVFGNFLISRDIVDLPALEIKLSVNCHMRQCATTRDMLFSPAHILSFVSKFMTIEEGDIFMTGTPSGVGEVRHGDLIEATIEGLPPLRFAVLRHRQPC